MKKPITLILLTLLIQLNVLSQSCLPNGINFSTQAQIDNFQINNPNCTEIQGDVIIGGNDITNLNGLSVLTSLGGELRFQGNNLLQSFAGLGNVTSVADNFVIVGNGALTNLTGLGNLASIGGDLWIAYNDNLANFTGLNNLTYVGAHLSINGNGALTSISELASLNDIGGHLEIIDNDILTSLYGFGGLSTIGSYLLITDNDALNNITSFGTLISIGGDINIEDNLSLLSLSGLNNISISSIDNLYIKRNFSLSACETKSICDYLASPSGIVSIYDNATGCNSQPEVVAACASVSIKSVIGRDNILIYPNPAEKELFISVDDGTLINEVNVYNQLGQMALQTSGLNGAIDVSMLMQGMYIIEIVSNEWTIREKLVIK